MKLEHSARSTYGYVAVKLLACIIIGFHLARIVHYVMWTQFSTTHSPIVPCQRRGVAWIPIYKLGPG